MNHTLTVLSYGGGQDSSALLVRLATEPDYRQRWAPGRLLVLMSDTGNEHPETYKAVDWARAFCARHGIDFDFLPAGDQYHSESWADLKTAYRKYSACGSKNGFKKTCTVNLNVAPIYRFLEAWVGREYGLDAATKKDGRWSPKKALPEFARRHGRIRVILGFSKGEEKRVSTAPALEAWRRDAIEYAYPLIEDGQDRAACQAAIAAAGEPVPPPSNCMICPFLDKRELLLLRREHPAEFAGWVAMEQAKLAKWAHLGAKNYGVNGRKTLEQVLAEAEREHGHLTTEELRAHRFSHGHCVQSQY